MKKAEQIKINDTFWEFTNKDGFIALGKVKHITKPGKLDCKNSVYYFELDKGYPHEISMWPGSKVERDYNMDWFYIVPEDKDEIELLNTFLRVQYTKAQSHISSGIKSLLGIE